MITLSGVRPGIDIEGVFSGKRPGEKLYEELLNDGENVGETTHPKIGIWKHRPADGDSLQRGIERLVAMADAADGGAIRAELKRIVPEYTLEFEVLDVPDAPIEQVPRPKSLSR